MQTFQNLVTIARPVGEVFAFLADLRNIPRWNYAITRTVPISPGPAGAGATYRQTRTIPRRSEESLQITFFQPPTRLAVRGQLGPFRAMASYLLEPVPSGTRLANDVELEPMSALLRPISARWRYPESRPRSHVTSARLKSCWKAPARPPKSVRDVRDRAKPSGAGLRRGPGSSGRVLIHIAGRRWEPQLLIALAVQKRTGSLGQPRASCGGVLAEVTATATGYESARALSRHAPSRPGFQEDEPGHIGRAHRAGGQIRRALYRARWLAGSRICGHTEAARQLVLVGQAQRNQVVDRLVGTAGADRGEPAADC
jgi:hypothetical protein